jgi:hypothetical protein
MSPIDMALSSRFSDAISILAQSAGVGQKLDNVFLNVNHF